MRTVLRVLLFSAVVAALSVLLFITTAEAQNPSQDVLVTKLGRAAAPLTTGFDLIWPNERDSLIVFQPYQYTGILLHFTAIHEVPTTSPVAVSMLVYSGHRGNMILNESVPLGLTTASFLHQLDIPISRDCRIVFAHSPSTDGDCRIDSVFVLRQW